MDTEIQGSSREERGLEGPEQESDTGEASCNFYFFSLVLCSHEGTFWDISERNLEFVLLHWWI